MSTKTKKGTGGTLSVLWQGITRSPSGFTGMCIVVAILAFVFLGRFLVDHDNPTDPDALWLPMSGEHWLGTNFEGKDTFTKLVLGGAEPIWVGALAAAITVVVAVILGALAGYLRGRFDDIVLQATDITMTIPFITVLIIVASYFRNISPLMVALIIGLLTWPFLTRSIRAQVLTLKEREFIEAAKLQNLGTTRVVFVDILPNMAGYIFINFIIAVTNAIYAIVGLYLLGLLPSTAENWGLMIQQAWQNSAYLLPRALPFLLAPLAMIALFQVGLVLVTRSLEQALNPRLRER
ncbi:peptide ABC transporter permease [Actinorhabdospora filicis]|uniref:Peptide ABC transporter permease n=1 Tax=Actinorhabdospora filicis TaxID=1785913 RepID=A0A9W6W6J4_9ACTN|nr:ABC transporter permease [Actinorhabdospora filicis]GLZ81607.1 peptide ABC transporter permease [Actinorhabdospora filicis]